jgi:uncharacterized ion transporter superfamily protein YfcC
MKAAATALSMPPRPRHFPNAFTVLFGLIIFDAMLSWVIPILMGVVLIVGLVRGIVMVVEADQMRCTPRSGSHLSFWRQDLRPRHCGC